VKTVCSCPCGETRTSFMGEPLLRVLCHCKICQEVYGAPFADFVMLRSQQITKPVEPGIRFAKHRAPPAVNRGVCPSCHKPVVAFMPLAPCLGLAFVPTANLPSEAMALEPALHSFYDRRIEDVHDSLPKVCGYWASQWAVTRRFLSALLSQGSTRT
jgi:hypothetical protein